MNKSLLLLTTLVGSAMSVNSLAAESSTTISGSLEVEMNASTISTPTAEINFNKLFRDGMNGDITLLYEDGVTGFDSAMIHISPEGEDTSWDVGFGNLPFGGFETSMASDPLTLELGETKETFVQYNKEISNLTASFYLFNGTNNVGGSGAINNYGFQFTHSSQFMRTSFGFINDIGETNGLQQAIFTQLGHNNTSALISGQSIALSFNLGAFTLNGETVSAFKSFQAGQVEAGAVLPSATNLELGYAFDIAGTEATLALGSQSSRDAAALGIPKNRTMIGLNTGLQKNASFILQYSVDTDYASAVTSEFTAKLVAEF